MSPPKYFVQGLREYGYRNFTHRQFRRKEECDRLVRWLDAQPGERILDVGCGDGFYDHRIASRGASVVGIDMNQDALAIAERKNKTERIQFHLMDAEKIPFEKDSFDKAVSFCVIEHFYREDKVLSHLQRVLKPGGALVLSADSLSTPGITDQERALHKNRYSVNTFYTKELMTAKLERFGFEVLDTRYLLTTPLSLCLARVSWRVDESKSKLGGWLAHLLLNTSGKGLSTLSEKLARRDDAGLTLLIRARKV